MGWEYHDRRRDKYGRFSRGRRTAQLHLYCTPRQAEAIRVAALASAQDVSCFCITAIMKQVEALQQQQTVNGEDMCISGDAETG